MTVVLLLVTGASGAGKSTARALVERDLAPLVECVELVQLVSPPTRVTRVWRQQTAETAVCRAIELQSSGRHLLLCGDPVPAVEVAAAPSAPGLDAIAVCLLDLSADVQAARLTARGDDPVLLPHHQAFAGWMRNQARDPLHMLHVVADAGWEQMRWERLAALAPGWRMQTVDTSDMNRQDVATAVHDWCRRALRGEAPTISVAGL